MQCASLARRLAGGTIFLHVLFNILDDSFLSFFFSSAWSPFHRVIVIGSISLHSEVMNAVCQIAHARAADAATIAAAVPSDGRASPSARPAFNFTSSSIPAIACISTTIHSHMARALFWDSEFRCRVLWPQALVNANPDTYATVPSATLSPVTDVFLSMLFA
jgi:hypothetical protein